MHARSRYSVLNDRDYGLQVYGLQALIFLLKRQWQFIVRFSFFASLFSVRFADVMSRL